MMRRYSFKGLLVVLAASLVFASAAGAAQIEFGINASKTKVGDGLSVFMYGPGSHNIVISGDKVYAAYIIRSANRDFEVRLGLSHDGGLTWDSSPVIANGPDIGGTGSGIDLGLDQGVERIHMVWTKRDSGGPFSVYHTSGVIDMHGRWDESTPPVVVSGSVNVMDWTATVSADDQGGVHISYIGPGDVLYYTKLSSGGAVIDETATQVPLGVSCYQQDAVADSIGNLNVACNSLGNMFYIRRDAGTGVWGALKQINLDDAGLPITSGLFPSVAVLGTNNVYIAWDGDDLYVSISEDSGATWPTAEMAGYQWGGWASILYRPTKTSDQVPSELVAYDLGKGPRPERNGRRDRESICFGIEIPAKSRKVAVTSSVSVGVLQTTPL